MSQSIPVFLESVKCNKTLEVKDALEAGMHVDVRGEVTGETALWSAAHRGHAEMVKLLLAHGADVEIKENKYQSSPLHAACQQTFAHASQASSYVLHGNQSDYVEVVAMLLGAKADMNTKNIYDNTPLVVAARQKSTAIVDMLLEHGAPVNQPGRRGRTPLHAAVSFPGNEISTGIIKSLLKAGASLDTKDDNGDTPLSDAARFSNAMLLEKIRSELPLKETFITQLSHLAKIRERIVQDYAAPDEDFDMGNSAGDSADTDRKMNATDSDEKLYRNSLLRSSRCRA